MTAPAHSVAARLARGWVEQACDGPVEADRLFDRLRALNPLVPLRRLSGGRVVEVAGGAAVDARPG